jgi:hypothetical protein
MSRLGLVRVCEKGSGSIMRYRSDQMIADRKSN